MTTLRLRSPIAYRIAVREHAWARDERGHYGTDRGPDDEHAPSVHREDSGARLAGAVRASVLHAVTSERAAAYLTIMGALLSMRREHELQPLVDDLERVVGGSDAEAFARDLAQLTEWGCVEKQIEPLRIRGYKDTRRERFRYRLSLDAVALLEWLGARARERREGGRTDGRDLLTDVLGQLRELERVTESAGEPSSARRALHLLSGIDDAVDAITEELIAFRAQMLGFATAAYDGRTLREIVAWLERYVTVHLAAVHALRGDIDQKLVSLSTDRSLRALDVFREALESERASAPRAIRGSGVLPEPEEQLAALQGFFGTAGRLVELCTHIDGSAREVVRKLHGHLRELERRSARRAELGRALAAVQAGPTEAALSWLEALMSSVEVRSVPVSDEGRSPPPLPRRHVRAIASRTPPLLAAKLGEVAPARGSRQKRREALERWLHEVVLGPRDRVQMSTLAPLESVVDGQWARGWIELARARHLGRGRELRQLDVRVTDVEGAFRVATEAWSLEANDCVVERDRGSRRPA